MHKKNFLFTMVCVAALTGACSNLPDMNTAKQANLENDYKTSVSHYQRLAEFGLPEAKVELGRHYLDGRGVEKNPQKALALFNDAQNQKTSPRIANYILRTQAQLGAESLTGTGGIPAKEGVVYLKRAADAGDARSMFNLATAYEKGIGVPQDIAMALDYYRQAGALGYGRADYTRASIYEKGKIVAQDIPQAVVLYKAAADKDYPRANLNLARLYEKGLGVKQDLQLAQVYYQKAESQGITVDNNSKKLQKN